MDDLIFRSAAIEAMTADNLTRNLDSVHDDDMKRAARAAQRALARIPAAQRWIPEVRGKWNRTDAYPHRLYCSVCYKTYLKNDELLERWEFPLNFCPNCGADMREEPLDEFPGERKGL